MPTAERTLLRKLLCATHYWATAYHHGKLSKNMENSGLAEPNTSVDYTGVWISPSIKVPGLKINIGEWMKAKENNLKILNLFNTHIGNSEQQVKLNDRDFNTDVEGRRGVRCHLGTAVHWKPWWLQHQLSVPWAAYSSCELGLSSTTVQGPHCSRNTLPQLEAARTLQHLFYFKVHSFGLGRD